MSLSRNFSSCRIFELQDCLEASLPIRVYVAKKGLGHQSEWVLRLVATHVWTIPSATVKELRKKIKDLAPRALELHSEVWPDSHVELLESKCQNEKTKKRKREDQRSNAIFPEKTVPTSMFFAFVLAAILHPKRKQQDKLKPIRLLQALIVSVCRVWGKTQRAELLRGSLQYGSQRTFIEIDTNGSLLTSLWDDALDCSGLVAAMWNKDLCDTNRPWVTSNWSQPHVADLVCFCLAPSPSNLRMRDAKALSKFKQVMQEPVHFLLGHFARQLEKHIVSVTKPPMKKLSLNVGEAKNKKVRDKFRSPSVIGEIISKCLELLYSQQAS